MGTRENKVERYLDAEVTRIGGLTWKWVSPGRIGVTDRIVRLGRWPAGVVHMVEVKTEDGEISGPQRREQQRLNDAGCVVHTVFGSDGVDEYIRSIDV